MLSPWREPNPSLPSPEVELKPPGEVPCSASSPDREAAGLTGQEVRAGEIRVLRAVFRLCPMSLFETQQGTG